MKTASGSALSVSMLTALVVILGALPLAIPTSSQSQSPLYSVALLEIDVQNAPSSMALDGHGFLDGVLHGNPGGFKPDLMICAREKVNANGTIRTSCSVPHACRNSYDCMGVLTPALPLTSGSATLSVTIYDVATDKREVNTPQFDIPSVKTYDTASPGSTAFTPGGYGPDMKVTVKLDYNYNGAIGALTNLARGKNPISLIPSPANALEGAQNERAKEDLSYDRCLGTHASVDDKIPATTINRTCGMPGDPGYANCVLTRFADADAQGACLTTHNGQQIEQPVNGTWAQTLKSYVCGVAAWLPASWSPSSCSPAQPAASDLSPWMNSYQACVWRAAESVTDPLNNNQSLASQVNPGCNIATNTSEWEICAEHVLCSAYNMNTRKQGVRQTPGCEALYACGGPRH